MTEVANDEHDYYCDCSECTELMYASLDRLNATLARFGPSRATIIGAPPRTSTSSTGETK